MRVLVRWQKNNTDDSENEYENELVREAVREAEHYCEKQQQKEEEKSTLSSQQHEESVLLPHESLIPAVAFASVERDTTPETVPTRSPSSAKKRPRSPSLDSKPAAVPMVNGGRVRRRSEELDEELLENEPPPLHHHRMLISVHSAPDEPLGPANEPYQDPSPSERAFSEVLKKERGLEIVEQAGDGNCLFRAVSLQVYGDANMHAEIRERCLDFMERDPEHFAPFCDGDFAQYIRRKRRLGVHGNNPEIQAMSELFNRPVEVFTPDRGAEPLNIFQSTYKTMDTPIRLSYHDGNHYNAVIDPLVPTAGLGLGLPGLQPGLADKLQLAKAVVESDHLADEIALQKALEVSRDDELQRAIQESSALVATKMYDPADYITSRMGDEDFDVEQKVLMQSLEEYRRQEGQKRRATSASVASSSTARLPDVATDPATSFAASAMGVASIPLAASRRMDEYPPTVQELVMNGFELRKVVHAYELIGEDFNDLLAFLMSNS